MTSLRSQVSLKGIVDCLEYSPNKFKMIKCTNCGHELHDHKSKKTQKKKKLKKKKMMQLKTNILRWPLNWQLKHQDL